MRLRARRLLPLLALPGLFAACEEASEDSAAKTAYVRKIAQLKGEDVMLRLEDERRMGDIKLRAYLADRDPQVRRRAALSVGRLRDQSMVEALKPLLNDPDKDVRGMAAFAAGAIGDPQLQPDLERMLADPSYYVRASAVDALSRFGGESLPPGVRTLLQPGANDDTAVALAGDAAVAATRYLDPTAADLIAPLLQARDAETRWRAAWALGQLKAGGPALEAVLGDPDPRVRTFAALGSAAAGHAPAVPALIGLLEDPDTLVASAAARALGELRDGQAAAALAAMATHPLPRRRLAAIEALGNSGLAVPTLQGLLTDPNPYVRAMAVAGLRRARAGNAILRQAVKDPDWRPRAAAAAALAEAGDVETLAKERQYDEDARVIPPVLEGLARSGYDGLDNLLLKHLDDKDPGVRATAARLIAGRGVRGATERLTAAWEMSRRDDILAARLAIVEAAAREPLSDPVLNILKQAAMDQNYILRRRAYDRLVTMGKAGGIEPPGAIVTLRTETYYQDTASRGDYDYHLTLETDKGTVVFRLYPKVSPLGVRFLDEISQSDYFLDKPFTVVRPADELVFGDDRGDGLGHYPAWARDEPSETAFNKVQLTLLRPLGRDSGSSQVAILLRPRPELDGIATPLGELLSGGEVLDQIEPGTNVKSLSVTAHEFRGKVVVERVTLDRPVVPGPSQRSEPSGPALGAAVQPGAWSLPPTLLYMAVVGAIMLLASVVPLVLSSERREDFPLALWVVVLLIVAVAGFYSYLILTGGYYALLTHEQPGPRFLDKPNPPILQPDQAMLACTGALGYIVLELALLYFLIAGKPFARWLFLFLSLAEIALFTGQIATRLAILSIISQVGIGINLFKIWFLLMDRQAKEYLAPE